MARPSENVRFARFVLPLVLSACAALPEPDHSANQALPTIRTGESPRLNATLEQPRAADDQSGIYLLADPQDAFVARATLIAQADHTLDMAYYIWHDDVSGSALMQMLIDAARRGVQVRLLLDDNNTAGMDNLLAALNAEPNIQVRLFNPFQHRRFRAAGYLTDFSRLNRRMHNKSLIADRSATIVGGRNIGDEYFNVTTDVGFADLDILASGRIVDEVSEDFERYWNSRSSYPFEQIVPDADQSAGRKQLRESEERDEAVRRSYSMELAASPLFKAIQQKKVPWEMVNARLISDDPAKALPGEKAEKQIGSKISDAVGTTEQSLYIVSPYFVPTRQGADALSGMSRAGKHITVLTNSLRATDVAAVHSGYTRYRKELLEAGVSLYELKPDFAPPPSRDRGLTGSTSTSLHAKLFISDRKRLFVGSFNFDPRSANLNTEMGVIIDHPPLAAAIQHELEQTTPQSAYRVVLDQHKKLRWIDPQHPQELLKKEPDAGFWKRLGVRLLSILPIESLL